MSKKIYGGYDVSGNATTENRRMAQSIDGDVFDANGNMAIDTYTKQEFEDIVGVLPLSHYGTHTYLPAGVSGDFVGASDVNDIEYRLRAVCLEDDGMLTVLRSGTNGAERGVYYSVIPNALNTTNLTANQNTNKKYEPGYLRASAKKAMTVFPTDNGVVSGFCEDSAGNRSVYLSWRNGTLDDTQHSGSILPISSILPDGQVHFVMTGNTEIFFFIGYDGSNQYKFAIRSVPISSIRTGAANPVITNYPNWTTSEFNGKVNSNTDILMLSKITSKVAADKPYLLLPTEVTEFNAYMGYMDLFCAQNDDGLIRMRCVGDCWVSSQSVSARPKHSFSFLLNLPARTAKLENNDTSMVVTYTPSELKVTGTTVSTDPIYTFDGRRANFQMSYFYSPKGDVFSYITQNLNSAAPYLCRAKYPNVTSVFQQMEVRKVRSQDWLFGSMYTNFGSVVGGEVVGFEWLPNNRYSVVSSDAKFVAQQSINEYKPGATFTFKSINLGTVKGFEPTTNRVVTSVPFAQRKVYIATVGSTVIANGGIFIDKYRLSTGVSISQSYQQSGTMSVNAAELEALKTSQLALTSFNVNTALDNRIVLYVPQQTDLPAFALITAITTDYRMFYRLIQVNTSTRNGNISISLLRFVKEELVSGTNISANNSLVGLGNTSIGLNIYDMGTHYFVGGAQPLYWATVGNSISYTFRASIQKSNGSMDFKFESNRSNNSDAYGFQPMACPGLGFGVFNFELGYLDDRVRVYFTSYGTTYADYQAWKPKAAPVLIAGQDVAQGFVVYFTEETPVLLSGNSFTMPITTINLTTVKANPANSTFHVYVKMIQGLAQYVISEIPLSESGTTSYTTFWIGTIKTGPTSITEINIEKRSRLDIFGSSLEARGSSFPISYGLPTQAGTINW